jgi:hypothetical protein
MPPKKCTIEIITRFTSPRKITQARMRPFNNYRKAN